MVIPPLLKDGDRVAIISPASTVSRNISPARWNFSAPKGSNRLCRHMPGTCVRLVRAVTPHRALMISSGRGKIRQYAQCSERGGYGSVHLLPHIDECMLRDNPKWLIGFSDISALHAMLSAAGVAFHPRADGEASRRGRPEIMRRVR